MFGLGGLVLGLVVFPIYWLLPGGEQARRERARRTVALAMRAFVWLMSSLGGISYEIRGAQRLGRPGQLVIANHPTMCDVIFLLGFSRDSCSIVKHQLFRNAFTALAVSQSGYVKNEPTEAMIEHHEETKFPLVRGMTPTPDPMASPFADLEDDLPWETKP